MSEDDRLIGSLEAKVDLTLQAVQKIEVWIENHERADIIPKKLNLGEWIGIVQAILTITLLVGGGLFALGSWVDKVNSGAHIQNTAITQAPKGSL